MSDVISSLRLANKTGWPWNVEIPQFSPTMPDGSPWPKISIVTPSFNQAEFIEETIRSVICQGYPNLEYIIIDGGSSDGSVEIIKKYENYITYWESEPDQGQAHAINKGISRITGDIFGWINSDDMLLPGSLSIIGCNHKNNEDKILLGDVINFYHVNNKSKIIIQRNVSFESMLNPFKSKLSWHQPGVFVPTKFLNSKFFLDERFRYYFDYEWILRLLQIADVHYLREVVAIFRFQNKSKTVNEKFLWLDELETVLRIYWGLVSNEEKKQIEANLEFNKAANHLGVKQWDRKIAIDHLRRSFKMYPKILFSIKFVEFLFRSLLPFSLIKFSRFMLIKVNMFTPNE